MRKKLHWAAGLACAAVMEDGSLLATDTCNRVIRRVKDGVSAVHLRSLCTQAAGVSDWLKKGCGV